MDLGLAKPHHKVKPSVFAFLELAICEEPLERPNLPTPRFSRGVFLYKERTEEDVLTSVCLA
jgi:hypothetical protein